jgi:hypothetical protein
MENITMHMHLHNKFQYLLEISASVYTSLHQNYMFYKRILIESKELNLKYCKSVTELTI